jgi:hypothetical protein
MATVWVVWDGAPKVFSSAEAATEYRNDWPQSDEVEIFEAEVDGPRLSLFQEWELESEKTYRAIGRFIYEFSQVEYSLRHAVADQLNIKDEHFNAVTATFDVAVLCNLAAVLFDDRAEMKKLINRFRELNNHRQRVAHGLWIPFLEGGSVHYTARSSLKGTSHKQQAEALVRLADDANNLRNEVSIELTGSGIYYQTEDGDEA